MRVVVLDADALNLIGLGRGPALRPIRLVLCLDRLRQIPYEEPGDLVLAINGREMKNQLAVIEQIEQHPGKPIEVELERDGSRMLVELTPAEQDGKGLAGIRVSAQVPEGYVDDLTVFTRYGLLESVPMAFAKTWEMTGLTLKGIWKMVTGQLSFRNIGGPVTIVKVSGSSAEYGFAVFVGFLAMLSITLGVVNLLPIPVLDGGHLMFYLVEAIRGGWTDLVIDQQQWLQGFMGVLQLCLTDKYGFSGLHINTGGGFLDADFGFQDFAGSGVVHLCGATAALAGVLLLGARKGKYGPGGQINPIPSANAVIIYIMDVSGSMGAEQKELVRIDYSTVEENEWIQRLGKRFHGVLSRH